jgi:hypothetical protein
MYGFGLGEKAQPVVINNQEHATQSASVPLGANILRECRVAASRLKYEKEVLGNVSLQCVVPCSSQISLNLLC